MRHYKTRNEVVFRYCPHSGGRIGAKVRHVVIVIDTSASQPVGNAALPSNSFGFLLPLGRRHGIFLGYMF